MPKRSTPFPVDAALGLAGWFVSKGHVGAAAIILMGFHGFLRIGECMCIRAEHLVLSANNTGAIALPWTKGSQKLVRLKVSPSIRLSLVGGCARQL